MTQYCLHGLTCPRPKAVSTNRCVHARPEVSTYTVTLILTLNLILDTADRAVSVSKLCQPHNRSFVDSKVNLRHRIVSVKHQYGGWGGGGGEVKTRPNLS